ncbi:hypothetical protein AK88_05467 [Plasmodium fragile]|nr:uncharacterized protein AK88_05467 [Plasmodium fragile]KJP84897.1 hypothetical protein AK88_05467 [Plasmodium fragile]
METIPLATDPCPPHDPDPCSCMETMQFDTDPCPLNEDNHDPWSCMDTIQLATDNCPPHDPDPWSCMETIQFATDNCRPNKEDPDPCKCMETIQLETAPGPPNDCDSCSCMHTIPLETDPFPPNAEDPDPWSCMESIQLAMDPCPPNEGDPDPWNCMETIQLEEEQSPAPTVPGAAKSYCTQWINWIDCNKAILRECTTQPWFNALKSAWRQYLREHMVANGASGEHWQAATMESKKHAWKAWVAQQHRQLRMYTEEWFQHLLHNVEEQTVTATGESPGVETLMGKEDVLRVTHAQPSQSLHPPPDMQKTLTAKTWILILAFVIEQCEVERSLQEKELCVDDLLEQL